MGGATISAIQVTPRAAEQRRAHRVPRLPRSVRAARRRADRRQRRRDRGQSGRRPAATAAAPARRPRRVLQRLDAQPVAGGYRIGAGAPPGLRQGDVLQQLNGTPLTSPDAARAAIAGRAVERHRIDPDPPRRQARDGDRSDPLGHASSDPPDSRLDARPGAAGHRRWRRRTRAAPADIVVNMRGVEIADVAEQISRLTGRTLILDPTVKGVGHRHLGRAAEPGGRVGPVPVGAARQRLCRGAIGPRVADRAAGDRGARRRRAEPRRGRAGAGHADDPPRQRARRADAARIVRPLVATFGIGRAGDQPQRDRRHRLCRQRPPDRGAGALARRRRRIGLHHDRRQERQRRRHRQPRSRR